MAQRLSEASPVARLGRCRAFVESLDEVEDLAGVRDVLLPGLAALLTAHLAVYDEVDRRAGREVALGWPAEVYRAEFLGGYPSVMAQHPIVAYTMALPAVGEPLRTSDLVSRRQWRANPVYREAYHRLEVDDQLAFGANDDGSAFSGISLARSGPAFTEWERDLVGLLAPQVGRALRRARRSGVAVPALQVAPLVVPTVLGGEGSTPSLPSPRSATAEVDPLTAREREGSFVRAGRTR